MYRLLFISEGSQGRNRGIRNHGGLQPLSEHRLFSYVAQDHLPGNSATHSMSLSTSIKNQDRPLSLAIDPT